jgi:hypothetical protein
VPSACLLVYCDINYDRCSSIRVLSVVDSNQLVSFPCCKKKKNHVGFVNSDLHFACKFCVTVIEL